MTKKKKALKEVWMEFSTVDPNCLITQDSRGIIYIGGQMADPGMLQNLRQEAEFFLESNLWKLLVETPKELAHKAMFIDGDDIAHLQKGRSILFMLSTQKKILTILKSYSQSTQKK